MLNSDGSLKARPTITGYPSTLTYGSSFSIFVSGAVNRVTLVRLGATTHGFDTNQRFYEFSPITGAGTSTIGLSIPSNGNILPPGYYMLFAISTIGVPSEARVIKIQ